MRKSIGQSRLDGFGGILKYDMTRSILESVDNPLTEFSKKYNIP